VSVALSQKVESRLNRRMRSIFVRIPEQSDHPFRTKAITYSGVSDHPAGRPASDGVS
jgi:hypothetical protein